MDNNQSKSTEYICNNCRSTVILTKENNHPQCQQCGGRILYKKRTKEIVQYLAR